MFTNDRRNVQKKRQTSNTLDRGAAFDAPTSSLPAALILCGKTAILRTLKIKTSNPHAHRHQENKIS
jgi:hypothetical protein